MATLILTSDERTWEFDRPSIFLGEWCRKYDRRHIWEKMDAIVARPYGLSPMEKDRDQCLAREIESELIVLISKVLNDFHSVNHNIRYWQILLGHWLRRHIEIISNRYNTLNQCLEFYQVDKIRVLKNKSFNLGTLESLSFVWAANDEVWNSILYSRILSSFSEKNIVIEEIGNENSLGFRFDYEETKDSTLTNIKKIFLSKAIRFSKIFSHYRDAVIMNSYLPRIEELKFQISLWQFPTIWRTVPVNPIKIDSNLRKDLGLQYSKGRVNDLKSCIHHLLFEMIPSCYLEGYANLCEQADKVGFPKNPRFIFTSNNFDTDDVFKCWAAQKAEEHTPYYIGQHGGNYGVNRFISFETVEEVVSDKFLTWGWTDGLRQHTPAFILKTVGKKPRIYNPKGGIVLIQDLLYQQGYLWDKYAEFCDYFQEQLEFVKNLDIDCKNLLVVRLHGLWKSLQWSDKFRWNDFDSSIKIDEGKVGIQELIKDSRLVIHSYDSTGILETLSQNIPTLAFWQYGLDHVRDSAKPYYELLVDAGIFHLSPKSIATTVNSIWEDVPKWWNSNQIQDARQKFCESYARTSKQPIRDLKKILTSN